MLRTSETLCKKVALLGASGGIGQPLSLLLRVNPGITKLSLYDIAKAPTPPKGIACDLSHIPAFHTGRNGDGDIKTDLPLVTGHAGEEELRDALRGADIVVMTAGIPRKPNMTRDDLFKINGRIVYGLSRAIAQWCPLAMICVISNPVNSTVPIVHAVLKENSKNSFDSRRIMGVTQLDCCRASTFAAEILGTNPHETHVPVVGGHAGVTILPLLSQVCVMSGGSQLQNFAKTFELLKKAKGGIRELDKKIQESGTDVVNAKGGMGSATLSMAYAASVFVEKVLSGLNGNPTTGYAYVKSNQTESSFLANECRFDSNGAISNGFPLNLSEYETERMQEVLTKLKDDIKVGEEFAQQLMLSGESKSE